MDASAPAKILFCLLVSACYLGAKAFTDVKDDQETRVNIRREKEATAVGSSPVQNQPAMNYPQTSRNPSDTIGRRIGYFFKKDRNPRKIISKIVDKKKRKFFGPLRKIFGFLRKIVKLIIWGDSSSREDVPWIGKRLKSYIFNRRGYKDLPGAFVGHDSPGGISGLLVNPIRFIFSIFAKIRRLFSKSN